MELVYLTLLLGIILWAIKQIGLRPEGINVKLREKRDSDIYIIPGRFYQGYQFHNTHRRKPIEVPKRK